jgi:hypothetical protein
VHIVSDRARPVYLFAPALPAPTTAQCRKAWRAESSGASLQAQALCPGGRP